MKPHSFVLQVIDYVETQQGGSLPSASSSREGTPRSGFSNDSSPSGDEEDEEADAIALRRVKRCASACGRGGGAGEGSTVAGERESLMVGCLHSSIIRNLTLRRQCSEI